jgi:hypothetical protein
MRHALGPSCRRRFLLRLTRDSTAAALLLAACDRGGPFEIEPRQLAGNWAGSNGPVDVSLRCGEEASTSYSPLTGQPGTSYTLRCRGSFRDAARGVVSADVDGGSGANSRAKQEVEFSFGVLTDIKPPEGGFVYYRYGGRVTGSGTITGSLVLEARRSTVFPGGGVGGPEIVTRMDSVPLTLRRG